MHMHVCMHTQARVVLKAPMPVTVAMTSSADVVGEPAGRGASASQIFDSLAAAEKEEKL